MMAKKKSKPKDSIATEAKEIKELQGRLDVAKELLDDKDKEVADLKQQIEDDKGIPPNIDAELTGLREKVRQFDSLNAKLNLKNKELEAKTSKSPASSQTLATTSVPASLIISCLGDFSLSMPTERFAKQIPTMVNNAILLAEAIRHRTRPPGEDLQ